MGKNFRKISQRVGLLPGEGKNKKETEEKYVVRLKPENGRSWSNQNPGGKITSKSPKPQKVESTARGASNSFPPVFLGRGGEVITEMTGMKEKSDGLKTAMRLTSPHKGKS